MNEFLIGLHPCGGAEFDCGIVCGGGGEIVDSGGEIVDDLDEIFLEGLRLNPA